MIDFDQIVGFDWDAGNARKSIDKHAVTQLEAEQPFFHEPLVAADAAHSSDELRFHALGVTDLGRRLHATFASRGDGTLIRVISVRDMSVRERHRYEQKEKDRSGLS